MIRMHIIFLLIVLSTVNTTFLEAKAFNTLAELQTYAASIEELPPVDNNDLLRPDYTTHYKKQQPSFLQKSIQKILGWAGLAKNPFWSPEQFKELLLKTVESRETQFMSGDFIQKVSPVQGSQLFIWGDIQGAFHSWVRVLTKLHDDGIINDDLKIIKDDCYFIFNGDLIDRSPYNLETLTLTMQLLIKNPYQAFYIRGNHEERDTWHDYGLLQDLEVRARHLSDEEEPLHTPINKFFRTLPLALYIQSTDQDKSKFVRISHYGTNEKRLNEQNYASFLNSLGMAKPILFDLAEKKESKENVDIPVLVKGISRSTIYQPTDGITMLSPERGATTWTLLSAPTRTYQELYGFFNDAFCIIDVTGKLSQWTITLNKQDIRTKEGFVEREFNLLFGREIVDSDKNKKQPDRDSNQPETMVIASMLDKSKTVKDIGKSMESGLTLRINKQNTQGGVKGTRLQLFVYDDKYTPSITIKKVREFLSLGKSNILLSPLGSPTTKSLLPQIKNKEILVLFPYTGAGELRKPEYTNLVHYRTSYENESRALLTYAIDVLKKRRFAFFYQNDAYGKAGLGAALEMLKKRNITSFVEAPYIANTIDVSSAVEKIQEFSPDVIIFFSVLAPSQELIRQIGSQSLSTKHLLGISPLTEAFRTFLRAKGLSFTMSQIVPNPSTSDLEVVKEYRQSAQEIGVSISGDGLESFINASLFIHTLESIQPPYTPEKIVGYLETLKHKEFKGLKINFDDNTRELSKNIWVGTGDEDPVYYDATQFTTNKKESPTILAPIESQPRNPKSTEPKKKALEISIDSFPALTPSDKALSPDKGEKLVIGSSLWVSEGVGLSPSIMRGIALRANQANKSGGIAGKYVELVFLDDKYEPDKARKNIELFLEKYKTNVVLCPNGSPTLQGYLDLVEKNDVFVAFPITGAGPFRKDHLRHVVHLRASYPDEARALTRYAVQTLGAKRVAVFYQQDLYGETGLEGTRQILKENNITDFIEVGYQRRVVDMSLPAKKIKDFNPDAIIFYATDKAGAALIRQLGVDYLGSKKMLGYSDFSIDWFQRFVTDKGVSFAVAQLMPDWKTSDLAIAKQFRQELETDPQQKKQANQFVFESYVASDILFDQLEKNKDSLNKESLIASFEAIKNQNYKGLDLNFVPQTRELSRTLWINPGTGEKWIKQDLGLPAGLLKSVEQSDTTKTASIETQATTNSSLSIDHGNTIVVGSSIWTTEGVGVGPSRMKGMSLRVNEENKKGGINGRKLKVIFLDDKYTPEGARKNAQMLLSQYKTNAFVCPGGTPTLEAYIDLVKEKKFFVFFPSTGADIFRTPELDHLVHIRASYGDEAHALVEYAAKNFNTKRLAIFYQNDSYGQAGLKAAQDAAKQLNIADIAKIPYERKTLNMSEQKQKILDFKPDTILLFATTKPAAALIKQMGAQNLASKHILAPSPLTLESFKKMITENGLKVIYSNVMPNWTTSKLPIVQQFRNELVQVQGKSVIENKKSDSYVLEGYLSVDLMIDIIKRTGETLALDNIIDTINNTKDYEYKGLTLSLNPKTHALAKNVWIQVSDQELWISHFEQNK